MVKEAFSGWIRLALALPLRGIVRASLTKTEGKCDFQTENTAKIPPAYSHTKPRKSGANGRTETESNLARRG